MLYFSVEIWKLRVIPELSLLSSFLNQGWFYLAPKAFFPQVWRQAGLKRLLDISDKGGFLNNTKLKEKLLKTLSWFSYFQLNHLPTQFHEHQTRLFTDFKLIFKRAKDLVWGLIAKVFKNLIHSISTKLTKLQRLWQTDCSLTFSNQDCHDTLRSTIFKTSYINMKIQSFKFLSDWYFIPLHVSHMKKMCIPLCSKQF